MKSPRLSQFVVLSLLLVAGEAIYVFSLQRSEPIRFDFGSMDWDFLADPSSVSPRTRMKGPFRHRNGTVEVIEFYGRITTSNVRFQLPYHASNSPLLLRIRCHRFGLKGSVELFVNGKSVQEFVFTETSYPWGGIQAVIPQGLAEEGPLQIELRTRNGLPSPSHLPKDIGVGIDWIEVEPLSKGLQIIPSSSKMFFVALSLIFCFGFFLLTGSSFQTATIVASIAALILGSTNLLAPSLTGMALSRLWVTFPLGFMLWKALFSWSSLTTKESAFLARSFTCATLLHAVLIFFPNHAPPDIWNHLPQVEWLSTLNFSLDEMYRFASSSDPFDDGHVRPHFGVQYGAPYPPIFYVILYLASFLHGDTRFLLEFLAVLISAAIMVPIFLTARYVWQDRLLGYFAVLLLIVEISIWHHAHRVHAPGNLGQLFFVFWIYLLISQRNFLLSNRGLLFFAFSTMLTVLSYPATLVHVSIFSVFFALLLFCGEEDQQLARRFLAALTIGFTLAFTLYYGPYVVQAVQKANLLLDRTVYDPPASFFFLRNQMRDTVRILTNGYPVYVILSVGGFLLLPRSGALGFHRKMLYSLGLTYLTMLILKDPALLPMIFLHAKEDLFYAPVACLLISLVVTKLWRRSRITQGIVLAFFTFLTFLQVRDQALNHNTLLDQQIQR